MDMTLILGGKIIPYPSTFKRITDPNETDNITIGGTLYTDFVNTRRSWRIGWKLLKASEFEIIYDLWRAQYTNHAYNILQFDVYGIYAPVKMEISEQDIKFNGVLIENFTMVLKEQYAIS